MNDTLAPRPAASSSRMVEFLLSLNIDSLPATVIHDARLRLLDSLGCALYGATTPWGMKPDYSVAEIPSLVERLETLLSIAPLSYEDLC